MRVLGFTMFLPLFRWGLRRKPTVVQGTDTDALIKVVSLAPLKGSIT